MTKCVQCGKETLRPTPVCHDCVEKVLTEALREGVPVVGNRPEARRIGFQKDER